MLLFLNSLFSLAGTCDSAVDTNCMVTDTKSELLQLHLKNQNSFNSSSKVIHAQKMKEAKLKTHGRGNYN